MYTYVAQVFFSPDISAEEMHGKIPANLISLI
jgi:hypothetical protein